MMMSDAPKGLVFRKSARSGGSGTGGCVEVAKHDDGHYFMRDSKDPNGSVLCFTHREMAAWISGCKDGEFDDLI